MGKIQEAQDILKSLGLPHRQQNDLSALTLLVLAQLSEETPWREASKKSLRIHDMIIEIQKRYDTTYAENSRESIRRQVIHQFEQASIVERNPDDLNLPTNSPRTHYALSDAALNVVRSYGSSSWEKIMLDFIKNHGMLYEIYRKKRDRHKVPLVLPGGKMLELSPGKHNKLQAEIIQEFGPRFAQGAKILYLGDTADKLLFVDNAKLLALGIPTLNHDKLPDVVLYEENRNWIFLVEAVTSHGPVSSKRYIELEDMLKKCTAGKIYVSAFPDFVTFKKYIAEIAWETEVWISSNPDHLIHFNGDRFMGPR